MRTSPRNTTSLAKATIIDVDVIVFSHMDPHPTVNEGPAGIFIVSLLSDTLQRAVIGTLNKSPLPMKEAIIPSSPIRPRRWL